MAKLILYNDDLNSCEKVKASLIRFCQHGSQQAEQCVLIADSNGKVSIKNGDFMEMLIIKEQLEMMGLKVKLID
jgi:ATP-dependent Clp protease adaptor protein ClpS